MMTGSWKKRGLPWMLAEGCGTLYRQLCADGEEGQLALANSLWMAEDHVFRESYVKAAQDDFYAELYEVDFGQASAGEAMGKWIAEHTNGTLEPQIHTEVNDVLAILNTVYLYSEWEEPFQESRNTEGTFSTLSGEEADVTYMHQEFEALPWLRGDGYTGTALDMKNGTRMVLILPEEGTELDELLAADRLEELFGSPDGESGMVELTLPKFSLNDRLDLIPVLRELGVEAAFGPAADFSEMTDGDVFISRILQETHVEVNEEGAEASAYTEVMVQECAALETLEEVLVLRLDRPFLYGFLDDEGIPLFLGICGNPAGEGADGQPGLERGEEVSAVFQNQDF